MKVDVTTLDGQPMSAEHATVPIGAVLHIAPAFIATAIDDDSGIETTIEARFASDRGRYVPMTIVNRAIREEFDELRLRHTAPQAIVQAAVPHCITLTMQEGSDSHVVTISDLTGSEGRILPPWLVEAVTKRGAKDERWDAIEVLYATAALASLPPVKLISLELDVPERTAGDWIQKSRAAGRLLGLKSNVGRPAGES
ncbi:hypothetical protein [Microbacterium sp.]|uniref:hypothetical protein n=1 Tax=Microbacterium sp. TaxID=51671 RepID=UPI0025E58D34|nr:hypothetical protein [Microbacterium sp.]